MASRIEWTEMTWNPTAGCSLASPGCTNCYAMKLAARLAKMGQEKYAGLTQVVNGNVVWTGEVRCWEDALLLPLERRKPTVWFVDSMSDLFHADVPFDFIDRVFAVMALAPQHTFQVLTKRPERMQEYCSRREGGSYHLADVARQHHPETPTTAFFRWPLPNVWLGTSVEDQRRANERIPHLLRTPAAVRFLSCEPLLGPVRLKEPWIAEFDLNGSRDSGCEIWAQLLHWVITGGESGPDARPCHPEWVRSLRDQCRAARVAFFHKQWGEWCPVFAVGDQPGGKVREGFTFPDGQHMWRLGKKAAGRTLDGRTWEQFPEPARA